MNKSADIFLSYNREDQPTARRFAEGFERAGFSVWWDVTLKSGEDYDKVTEQALREARAVVVLWSKRSVESRWVRAEATEAATLGTLVPVMIEPCKRPIMFELKQTADLSQWQGDDGNVAWRTLLADVRAMAGLAGQQKQVGPAATPVEQANQLSPLAGPSSTSSSLVVQVLVGVVGVLIAVMLLLNVMSEEKAVPTTENSAASSEANASASAIEEYPRTAVAVMAFANITGDTTKDYLGDGMSEELILTLGKVPGLTVPSRTSTFAYKGRNTSLKQIASDLGVGTVLEGSVRAAGSTIRISATLIDAQTDRQLWSETYEREFTDIFALQDELARAIVQALQINLVSAQPLLADARPTNDAEAYRLFLEGIYKNSLTATEEAYGLFSAALLRDSNFARAYLGRAGSLLTMIQTGSAPASRMAEAAADAESALSLTPDDPAIKVVLGSIAAFRGEWQQAEQHFLQLGAGNLNVPDLVSYAVMLESVGHLGRTARVLDQSIQKAPANALPYLIQATNYSIMGNDTLAMSTANTAVNLGIPPSRVPLPQVRANALLRAGRPLEAAENLIPAMPPAIAAAGGEAMYRALYGALADRSQTPAALQQIQTFIKDSAAVIDPNTAKDIVAGLTMLGLLDEAFAFANTMVDSFLAVGTVGYAWGALWLPEMKAFRLDPRFQEYARRLKLFAYWNEYGPPDGCNLQESTVICQ